MSRPTITVAIPSYNKQDYIQECIESLLANKEYIDAIVVVDNDSSDNTLALAKEYSDVVCYKNDTNIGMAPNWNRCIELCETDWLMIMHADDFMLPGAMKLYRDMMKKYPNLGFISAASCDMRDKDDSSFTEYVRSEPEFLAAGVDALSGAFGVCSSVMVKKDAYDKLGMFIPESLSSDVDMWSRVASTYNVGFINTPTVTYRINPTSTGILSLVNRPLRDIRRDWDNLNNHIASYYPTEESRRVYLKNIHDAAPYSYWAVAKAKIRKRQFGQALQTILFIIFRYNGFVPLCKIQFALLKKLFRKKSSYES